MKLKPKFAASSSLCTILQIVRNVLIEIIKTYFDRRSYEQILRLVASQPFVRIHSRPNPL
jgi:uncharacterized membrane protein